MVRFVRSASLAAAALAVASTASAAVFQYQFKTYYDGSTIASTDTKVFSSVVAGLTVSDISGGASLSLHFKDTALPDASSTSKMQLDHLWLSGTTKGTVARQSGTGGAYGFSSKGFSLPEGQS